MMASNLPPKPWEMNANQGFQKFNDVFSAIAGQGCPSGISNGPPPLPPRPLDRQYNRRHYGQFNTGNYGGYNGFSSMYNPVGYNFNSCGGYGYNMNRMPMYNENGSNDFVRIAEESSRQAFESIESIVQAFASVSTMLESTYFAVHSSFRAVLGVADHFSRLKQHLAHIVSTLTIVRSLQHIIVRLLQFLGVIKKSEGHANAAWSDAIKEEDQIFNGLLKASHTSGRSSWPIVLFFAVVLGTPWLIWRLLLNVSGKRRYPSNWMKGNDDHYIATALYDFDTNNIREIPFKAGQQIIIAPRELQPRVRGWLLASVDGSKSGLIPSNYVKILGFYDATKNVTEKNVTQ